MSSEPVCENCAVLSERLRECEAQLAEMLRFDREEAMRLAAKGPRGPAIHVAEWLVQHANEAGEVLVSMSRVCGSLRMTRANLDEGLHALFHTGFAREIRPSEAGRPALWRLHVGRASDAGETVVHFLRGLIVAQGDELAGEVMRHANTQRASEGERRRLLDRIAELEKGESRVKTP